VVAYKPTRPQWQAKSRQIKRRRSERKAIDLLAIVTLPPAQSAKNIGKRATHSRPKYKMTAHLLE
jgi:hypothetical protein